MSNDTSHIQPSQDFLIQNQKHLHCTKRSAVQVSEI